MTNFLFSASYEVTNELALSVLQNIFTVKIPNASEWPPDRYLSLPEASTFLSLTDWTSNSQVDYNELISDILTEVMMQMNQGTFPCNVDQSLANGDANGLINSMTAYLIDCYGRVKEELDHKKRSETQPLSDALSASRAQVINFTSLVIQGVFDNTTPLPKLPFSPLYKPLLEVKLPAGFILDLITITHEHGWEEFKTVFAPLLQSLAMEGRSSSIVDSTYRPSLIALTELCEIKITGTNNRPICQLLSKMVRIYFLLLHLSLHFSVSLLTFPNVH